MNLILVMFISKEHEKSTEIPTLPNSAELQQNSKNMMTMAPVRH